MQRVDTSTAAAALPTNDPNGTPGYFTKGDPVGGTPATVPGQDWFNSVQEEILAPILAAGMTPDKAVRSQLLAALKTLFFSTGDGKLTLKTVADPGWVMANDGSLGNGSSGATTRANADTQALFELLWTNITNTWCPVQDSTGTPVTRGASATADFNANRRIVLPRNLGRALAIAGAGSGLTSRELGQYLGAETHMLTLSEMPVHSHSVTDPGHAHGLPSAMANTSGGSYFEDASNLAPQTPLTTSSNTTGISIQNAGGGGAHNNMPPETFWNAMIKL